VQSEKEKNDMRVNGGLSEILDEKRGRRQKGGLRKYN
jgi:hypothetical protein